MSTIVTQPDSTQRYGARRARSTRNTRNTRAASFTPLFTPHRLTRSFPAPLVMPGAGVLHVWRFRASWLPVAIHESEHWLSDAERNRARLHPNAAQRHRYVASRIMLRWIGANLCGLAPRDVSIVDEYGEQRGARLKVGDEHLNVDIAFAGIWVLIAIGQATLGLGVAMPRPGGDTQQAASQHPQRRASANVWDTLRNSVRRTQDEARQRHAARFASMWAAMQRTDMAASGASLRIDRSDPLDSLDALDKHGPALWLDLDDAGRWHVIDLPMPGEIHGAISLAQRIEQIHAVGWFGP
ncbi:4'-phosphopantetheinyl transferase family protein [Paraburkholderia tropica]|uniref:4'-phosphopantetheinyl transferase family protein n=1 Tax=Paraburkholderia tropica TaxID=92647 RepID=UPI002AB11E9E|nr:hypothetical protein [Paraburkholderia tropica]